MQALAEEYEIFEEKVTHETEDGDMFFAVAYEAMEELDKAQKDHRVWSSPTAGPFTKLRVQS